MGLFNRFLLRSYETNLGQKTRDEIRKTIRKDLDKLQREDRTALNYIQRQEIMILTSEEEEKGISKVFVLIPLRENQNFAANFHWNDLLNRTLKENTKVRLIQP